jgi:hypothetical protein
LPRVEVIEGGYDECTSSLQKWALIEARNARGYDHSRRGVAPGETRNLLGDIIPLLRVDDLIETIEDYQAQRCVQVTVKVRPVEAKTALTAQAM